MRDPIVLRALGALLTYPRPELVAALSEIAAAIAREKDIPENERARLAVLVTEMQRTDPLDLEARYVEHFDRGRAASLNLFEHLHGDSRDRGPAMVALMDVYAQGGYRLAAKELPDFLPVILEYLSCRGEPEMRAMLGDCARILRGIGETLLARRSGYAAVFAALLALAGERGLDAERAAGGVQAEPSIDEDWAEQPAFATPDASRAAGGASGSTPRASTLHFIPPRQA